MWLLKLHFAFSLLCILTFLGFKTVGKKNIEDNEWRDKDEKVKKNIFAYWVFFVPILNVLLVIILFVMILIPKKDVDKFIEENKKVNEENSISN